MDFLRHSARTKEVNCETTEQFMNVLEVVTANLEPDQIEYAELAVYGK